MTPSGEKSLEIGAVVRWGPAAALVRALGETAESSPEAWQSLERLVMGLTEPLRRLDELAADVRRALEGDDHAADEVRTALHVLAARVSRADLTAALGERSVGKGPVGKGRDSCCGCGGDDDSGGGIVYRDGSDPSHPIVIPRTARGAEDPTGPLALIEPLALIDETALTSLLLGAIAVVGPEGRDAAIDVITALALGSGLLGSLGTAYDDGGEAGLVTHLERLAGHGQLRWVAGLSASVTVQVPPLMQTMSAGGPGMPGDLNLPAPGDIPGIPGGIPGFPGVPGGKHPGIPDVDDPLHDRLADLIAKLLQGIKKRPHWDPDLYDHVYPWWRPPIEFIDPRWWDLVRCFLEVQRQLRIRNEPPPARPARVVWADGITAVTLTGACGGSTVQITGAGFGATQPAGVVLVLPTLAGCRPVPPASWSDTQITAVLAADVASGPVGFADAAYVAAYDAWAAAHNAADDVLSRLHCAPYVPRSVPPFGECPPSSVINGIRAGAPVITAFTANFETLLALEPGVPIQLRWTVKNAETVTVERTSGSGPLFAGSTTLSNPVATSYGLGTPWYTSVQTWTYQITATGPCGGPVSRTVTVVATKRPGLRIDSIEVTQSIQTVPQAVRLVESKPTVVRVTVRHALAGFGGNTVPNVRGRIRVRGVNVGISPWFDAANGTSPMASNPGSSITVKSVPARNTTDDTLNFLIPPGWARGANTRVDVEVRVAGYGAAGGFGGFNEQVTSYTGQMTFEPRRALQFRFVRVAWNGGAAPTATVCTDTLLGAVPLLPTPSAGIAALGVGVQTVNLAMGSNGDTERRNLLNDFDDRHNCSTFESLFEWLGFDCPTPDGTIWALIPGQLARGEAFDIPSNVFMTPPSNGPYAAHELSHCLNQKHVSVACSNGQTATGGDAPSAWPNQARLQDVPFDVLRNAALTLAGTGVFDVMTYCGTPNNTWPMPVRWQRLWDEIGT